MDLAIVEGCDGPQPTALSDYQAILMGEHWSPNSVHLRNCCLAIGAAWLGGFSGFLIAVGFILIAGIALKHCSSWPADEARPVMNLNGRFG
jgi:hypothetical protein